MSDAKLDAAAAPPDWAAMNDELACPLCGYNLRGLVEPRCPECGFAFTWDELLNEQRNRHPYLFEHQPKHNIWSFWKTFWRDCRPRHFWREVSPANPVRLKRLLLYWLLANSAMLVMVIVLVPANVWQYYREMVSVRAMYLPVPGTTTVSMPYSGAAPISVAQLDRMYPLPSSAQFWWRAADMWQAGWLAALAMALLWPWLTLASLMVFQASMRRAKIRQSHVLRTVIYSCDFCLLLGVVLLLVAMLQGGADWEPFFVTVTCPLVILYRLGIAYKRYLRFDLPFLTVLASQMIVFLFFFTVLLNLDRL